MSRQVLKQIVLTATEKSIFEKVIAACDYHQLKACPRVAGGWVRDKLLGKESHDIDIAVDDMTGQQFANYMNSYLKHVGEHVGSIGVVKVNPDKSKHLETAMFKMDGVFIDATNFRSEVYEPNSRIPRIEMSTPKNDAVRRDFTVNALFYNIRDKCIEDFTELGLKDLAAGVLRTPLPPAKTFSDDPLRVIRAARFASVFEFMITPEIDAAAVSGEARQNLATKVSRERIGIEMHKILSSFNPSTLSPSPPSPARSSSSSSSSSVSSPSSPSRSSSSSSSSSLESNEQQQDAHLHLGRTKQTCSSPSPSSTVALFTSFFFRGDLTHSNTAVDAFELFTRWGLTQAIFELPSYGYQVDPDIAALFPVIPLHAHVAQSLSSSSSSLSSPSLSSSSFSSSDVAHADVALLGLQIMKAIRFLLLKKCHKAGLSSSSSSSSLEAVNSDAARCVFLAAFLAPYFGYRTLLKAPNDGKPVDFGDGKLKKFRSLVNYLVADCLKFTNKDAAMVEDLLHGAMKIRKVVLLYRKYLASRAATDALTAQRASSLFEERDEQVRRVVEEAESRLKLETGRLLSASGVYTFLAFDLARAMDLAISFPLLLPDPKNAEALWPASLSQETQADVDAAGQCVRNHHYGYVDLQRYMQRQEHADGPSRHGQDERGVNVAGDGVGEGEMKADGGASVEPPSGIENPPSLSASDLLTKQMAVTDLDRFEAWIKADSSLDGCWAWRPWLTGAQLSERYNVHNKFIGQLLLAMTEWRYVHPHGTFAECETVLQPIAEELAKAWKSTKK